MDLDNFRKKIGRTMRDLLDEGGITDEYLRKKLKKELNATEVKTYNYKGDILYSDPLVAWDIRQRARQDAHRLRGDYPAEEHEAKVQITFDYADRVLLLHQARKELDLLSRAGAPDSFNKVGQKVKALPIKGLRAADDVDNQC